MPGDTFSGIPQNELENQGRQVDTEDNVALEVGEDPAAVGGEIIDGVTADNNDNWTETGEPLSHENVSDAGVETPENKEMSEEILKKLEEQAKENNERINQIFENQINISDSLKKIGSKIENLMNRISGKEDRKNREAIQQMSAETTGNLSEQGVRSATQRVKNFESDMPEANVTGQGRLKGM